MRAPATQRHSLVYAWTVFAGGMVMLVGLGGGVGDFTAAIDSGSIVVLWSALILIATMSPLPLPWGRASASLTAALDVAGMLLFGPAMACWIGLLSRLASNATQRWRPLPDSILALGQIVLALGASGWVYTRLGGRFGDAFILAGDQALPIAGAVLAYVLVKGLLGAAGSAFAAARNVRRAFVGGIEQTLAGDLLLLPIGPLLALTQVHFGITGVALFLLPLLLARYALELREHTRATHLNMVRVLMSAIDASDPFTRDHSYRISRMCLRVGRHFGMRAAALEELEYAALLHDIGRTAIQRDILMKRGRLTEQEMQLLQAHPRIGAEIIGEQRLFPRSAEIVHAHHEQPDGKGYPRGLAGEAIPMGSRIIMAVAAFDAMTSDRPYRQGLSPDAALEELLAHSGTQFDPAVVEGLVRLYASGALFDEFDAAHLDHYRDGHEHSRAVESHLKEHGGHAGVPDKAGLPDAAGGKRPLPFPVIELPAEEPLSRTSETTVTLKAKGPWRFVVAGHSDVGCSRSNNEDSFGVYEFEDASRGCLLVLADGMGGAAAGEVASSLAVETVAETFGRWNKRGPVKDALSHAIGSANRVVHERAAGDSRLEGMGTTCTALAIVGLELTLGHVGDSRAYLVRRGVIEQLTRDHTLAGELERLAGTRSAAVAAASSHVLTRCIGAQPEVEVDLSPRPIPLEDGALLVLCSDGLSNVVETSEIQEIVSEEPPAEACASLVELARGRGGPDNITVIVGSLERG